MDYCIDPEGLKYVDPTQMVEGRFSDGSKFHVHQEGDFARCSSQERLSQNNGQRYSGGSARFRNSLSEGRKTIEKSVYSGFVEKRRNYSLYESGEVTNVIEEPPVECTCYNGEICQKCGKLKAPGLNGFRTTKTTTTTYKPVETTVTYTQEPEVNIQEQQQLGCYHCGKCHKDIHTDGTTTEYVQEEVQEEVQGRKYNTLTAPVQPVQRYQERKQRTTTFISDNIPQKYEYADQDFVPRQSKVMEEIYRCSQAPYRQDNDTCIYCGKPFDDC